MDEDKFEELNGTITKIGDGVDDLKTTGETRHTELTGKIELVENRLEAMEALRTKASKMIGFEARHAGDPEKHTCSKFVGALLVKDSHQRGMAIDKLVRVNPDHFAARIGSDGAIMKAATDDFLYTTDDPSGGYSVPTLIFNEISRIPEQESFVFPQANKVPQSSQTLKVNTLSTKPSVTYTNEAAEKDVTKPLLGNVDLVLKKPTAMVLLTQELLEDSQFKAGLVNQIITWIGEAFAADMDLRATNDANTPYVGIMHSSSGANFTTMNETTAESLSYEYLITMLGNIPPQVRGALRWAFHRTVEAKLRRIKDSTGNFIWAPANAAMPATILGYPYDLSEQMPTLTTASAADKAFMILANWKHWWIGQSKMMTFRTTDSASVTIDTDGLVSLFERNMMAIRAEARRSMAAIQPTAFSVLQTHA